MSEKDKPKEDHKDGKFSEADMFESHPDFQSEYEDMTDEFLKENNPGLHELQQRLRKQNADKGST